eukprot:gene19553-26235_t
MQIEELIQLAKTTPCLNAGDRLQLPAALKKLKECGAQDVADLFTNFERLWRETESRVTNANTQRNYIAVLKKASTIPEVAQAIGDSNIINLLTEISKHVQKKANDNMKSEEDDHIRSIYDFLHAEVHKRDDDIERLKHSIMLKDNEIRVLRDIVSKKIAQIPR